MDKAAKIARARHLLNTVNHAAMATVNAGGTPHNTPYFFMRDDSLEHLYWGSHPQSVHSQNVLRTGQIFVVLYDAMEGGGLFIRADDAHIAEGDELVQALRCHNERRVRRGKDPILLDYYETGEQRMWVATPRQFWTNGGQRDEHGYIIRDIRFEITREQLLATEAH